MNKKPRKNIFSLIFKILILIVFVAITALLIFVAIDTLESLKEQPDNNLSMLGFVLVAIVYGSLGYGITIILSLVLLIVSAIKKQFDKKSCIIYSVIFIVLSIITFVLFLYGVPKLV